ncbi:shikimate dehydrogenase [Opitutales bacterium]|nr:shikimate dehydrogenase [Opitutales bacterium]
MNELNFKQELTAAFGQPISENPTQVMIEAAYQHHNLDWRYLTIEVGPNDLEAAVRGAKVMGFQGFNCTIPHKVNVIQYLDGLGESASLMGAVNCVVRKDGKWIGENTDGKGFVSSLRELTEPQGKKVVIFGAGGAARAISVEVALAGAHHITIVNRSDERGEELTALLQDKLPCYADFTSWDSTFSIPSDTDVVINATSIGLFPDIEARLDFEPDSLLSNMVVADVIPNPPATNLVRDAREKGCKVIDGLGMLVSQGVIGVKHWTGIDPDPMVMRKALEKVFG